MKTPADEQLSKGKRGRPREFDVERALNAALEVFWTKGYQGASLPDLTAAMGINRPSLYAAFGNKEQLFRRVLDRYEQRFGGYVAAALAEPTARRVAERLLRGFADAQGKSRRPRGCLLVGSALACGEEAEAVREELCSRRDVAERAIRKRLERARREDDLPRGSDPADLARYIVTVVRGMSVQAAGGAGRAELRRVAELALHAWPT